MQAVREIGLEPGGGGRGPSVQTRMVRRLGQRVQGDAELGEGEMSKTMRS